MYKTSKALFLITETPLHAGSGDDLGVVDLPIQRERHTNFPKIEASSLKGALREAFEQHKLLEEFPETNDIIESQVIDALFGPEEAGNDGHAGALAITDARLLLFPVKSMKGVFAWITCPRILKKMKTDWALAVKTDFPAIPAANTVTNSSNLIVKSKGENEGHIVLEEFGFMVKKDPVCTALAEWLARNIADPNFEYWQGKIKADLVVLNDDDFTDFVQLSTEVITRIKIDNKTGTVADGALFTEEYLPSESILYSLIFSSKQFLDDAAVEEARKNNKDSTKKFRKRLFKEDKDTMDFFGKVLNDSDKINNIFQLGGNTTLGKGILRTKLI
jgi:CRISPR-associated protein Cmr4